LGSITALTAITSTRIYPEARAQGSILPAVVFSISEDETRSVLNAPGTPLRHAKVEVAVLADTAAAAAETLEVIYASLHGWAGQEYAAGADSIRILHCLHSSSLTGYLTPQQGESTGAFTATAMFSIMYQ
jgi:hypothetical protein